MKNSLTEFQKRTIEETTLSHSVLYFTYTELQLEDHVMNLLPKKWSEQHERFDQDARRLISDVLTRKRLNKATL